MDKENMMPTSDNSLPQQGAGVVDKDERSLPVLLVGERHEEVFILVEGTPEVSKRRALADAVLTHATKPAAWWALLEHTVQVFGADSRYIPQIRKLFRKATRNIPEGTYNNDVALVNIWLGFAEAESHVSMDDAREAYEHMKLCGIGSASAMYYTKWATFEEKAGRLEEARAILELGLRRKVNQDDAIRSQLRRLKSSTSPLEAGAAPINHPEEPPTARGSSPPTFSFSSPPITAVTPAASAPSSSTNKGSTSSCASSPLSAASGDNDVTVGASSDDRDPHTGVITLRERVSAGRRPLTFVPPTPTAKDSGPTITRAAATSTNSARQPTATPATSSAHKRTPVGPSFTVSPNTPSPSEAPDAGDCTSALPAGAGDLANRTGVVSFKPALETDEGDSHTGVVSFKRQQLGVEGVGGVNKGQLKTTNAQHERAAAKAVNPPSSTAVSARGDDTAGKRTTEPTPRGGVSKALPAGQNGTVASSGGGEGTSGAVAASGVHSGSASSSRESGDRHAANRGRKLQVSGLLGLGRAQRVPAAEKAAQSAKATSPASAPSSPKHASAVSSSNDAAVKDQRVKPERPATGGGGHASAMTGLQLSLLQTIEEQDTTASKQQHPHTHGQGGRRPDSIGGDTQDVIILKYSAAEPSRTPAPVRSAAQTGVAPSSAPPSSGSDDGSDARHSQHTSGSSGSSASSNRSSRQRQVDPCCAQPELSVTRDRAKACGGAASSVEDRHNVQRRSATPTAATDHPQPPPPPPQQQVHVQVQQHQQGGGRDSDTSRGGERSFEALLSPRNIMTLNGVDYVKLDLLGRGGSSKVFRVLSQAADIYALKRVRVQPGDERALESFANEITLLTRLKGHPSIIQLVDWAVDRHTGLVLMLMEIGETDLNRLLQQQQQPEQPPSSSGSMTPAATSPPSVSAGSGSRLSPNFVRYIWEEMLRAVLCVHEERIVHGDLKPANFVLVRGRLKLIDFGIAKAIGSDTTNIMRESQVGTVNYMSPEAILDTGSGVERSGGRKAQCMKMGRASDVWSLGCILYQMVYGRTPFADLGLIQKLQAIVDDNHEISFPSDTGVDAHVIDVLRHCLCRDPSKRPTIAGDTDSLLNHPYLTMAAHRCVREEGGRKSGTSMTWEAIEAVSSVLDREPAIVKLRGSQRAAALYQRLTSAKEAQGPTATRLPPPPHLTPHAPPSSAPSLSSSAAAPAPHSSIPPPQHHFRHQPASHARRPGQVALSEEIMCQRQKLKPVQQRQEEGLRRPAASPGGLLSIFRQGAAGIRRANAADETAGSSYHDTTTWS